MTVLERQREVSEITALLARAEGLVGRLKATNAPTEQLRDLERRVSEAREELHAALQ